MAPEPLAPATPVTAEPALEFTDRAASAEEDWRILPRILVVDDEPTVVDVFNEFLAAQGYEVTIVSNGEDAIRILPSLRPDIILTDINLPGVSGLDVMRHARAADPEVAVIVVTGYASAATAIDALRQGAYDYVTKPFDLDEVHQIVERGIANRRLRAINRQLVAELRGKNEILERHEQELRERVERATRQMTTLYEMGKEISLSLELEPRLQVITARAAGHTGAAAAVVYLTPEELEGFTPAGVHGFEWTVREVDVANVIRPDTTLAPAAFEQRIVRLGPVDEPIAVPGLRGVRCSSLLALPLVAEGHTIGVIAVFDKPEGFTADDEAFLTLFESQAAIAIRNSQLFEHTKSLDRLKSEFVAVVSHEIRTPLTSVKGAVELLSDSAYFQNSEQQAKLLAIAQANSERLLVLINDILDFSKLESSSLSMTLERQPLEPVLADAVHGMGTLLDDRRIALDIDLPPTLPDLHIDAGRVSQVLTNLLSNAIKFSPEGGTIRVAAEVREGAVRVSVTDGGEGIAAHNLPKLFRKFSQIDTSSTRATGGAGLGLVICKGIVEQHGGRIGVDSVVGEGSTFHFTLPLEGRPAHEPAHA